MNHPRSTQLLANTAAACWLTTIVAGMLSVTLHASPWQTLVQISMWSAGVAVPVTVLAWRRHVEGRQLVAAYALGVEHAARFRRKAAAVRDN
ncbi:hypothetical protein ACIBKY_51265 [Nonomuraea sp. NPDC050394]|uniref:hypothetical protein n=1 Tax=Nonomuraea sp. NPDC050394 TaxID=3364363 RepID=UPI0037960AB4